MINVLLVDDHASFLKSLCALLEAEEDVRVVATASDGLEAIAHVRVRCPDVAVMDISMPLMDGIEATRVIHEHCRLTRIMMLSIFNHPKYVQRALEVGASGFVLKESIGHDLLAAIRALYRGKRYFSDQVAEVAEAYLKHGGTDPWAI